MVSYPEGGGGGCDSNIGPINAGMDPILMAMSDSTRADIAQSIQT